MLVGLPGYVVVNSRTSVQEDDDAHQGGRDQHLCIQTQPGKVQSDLFTKILPEWDKNIKCTGSGFPVQHFWFHNWQQKCREISESGCWRVAWPLFSPHKSNGLVLEEDAVVGPLFIQQLSTIKYRKFGFRHWRWRWFVQIWKTKSLLNSGQQGQLFIRKYLNENI